MQALWLGEAIPLEKKGLWLHYSNTGHQKGLEDLEFEFLIGTQRCDAPLQQRGNSSLLTIHHLQTAIVMF